MSEESVRDAVEAVCKIDLRDDVVFTVKSIEPIRKDDIYSGYCVRVDAVYDAISSEAVVMDLCIDQSASDFGKKAPHDRGPHIRIPIRKLNVLFDSVEKFM